MATNKHAIIRYRTIDQCLRNPTQPWNWKSLGEACSLAIYEVTGNEVTLSERTIKGDIASMRHHNVLGFNAPIEYDRSTKSYYYESVDFKIMDAPLSQLAAPDLDYAIEVLQQLGDLKEAFGIQTLLTKLQSSARSQEGRVEGKVIYFESGEKASGQDWLNALYQAILNRKAISVVYQKFGNSPKAYFLSPHLLKEYQKRWYLLAYNHESESMRTYGLDRIVSIKESMKEYHFEETFDGNKYFNNVVGINVDLNQDPVDIVFKSYGLQSDYFLTKPLHVSQVKLRQEKDGTVFQVTVIPNYELLSELISYRSNIKILSPESIVQDMKIAIEQMNNLYT